MNLNKKQRMTNKARYIHGLINILKYDVDILRQNIYEQNHDKIDTSLKEVKDLLLKIVVLVNELDDIFNLDKTEGP